MRSVTHSDIPGIDRLLDAAFSPSGYETALVRRLRENKRDIHEWVIEDSTGIVAYICYSRAYRDAEVIGLHLAPLAVRPDRQGMGLGTAMVSQSLATPPIANQTVFVLGSPDYYRRFGFSRVASPVCSFDTDNQHFLALRGKSGRDYVVGYEAEFTDDGESR